MARVFDPVATVDEVEVILAQRDLARSVAANLEAQLAAVRAVCEDINNCYECDGYEHAADILAILDGTGDSE